MAKLAPRDLARVLGELPKQNDPRIVVGYEHADDAGVLRLNDDVSLVQTLDFFTPVADDPLTYGRIAAMNALNDVYAMGGTPVSALSIVCYPQNGDWAVLGEILRGGHEAMTEENVAILGGHSIDDAEIKFGYSVTGVVGKYDVITNAGARPGDLLILTKPLGTGVINTAVKHGKASRETEAAAIEVMSRSGRVPSRLMVEANASACTDVTGFGLLGHAYELASASSVTLRIRSSQVPLLPDVRELVGQEMLTRGDKNNREYTGDTVNLHPAVDAVTQSVLYDPQTAGGFLISVSPERASIILDGVADSVVIGEVEEKGDFLIEVE